MKLNTKNLVWLHATLLLYSLSTICSKMAAGHPFLSRGFVLWYGLSLGILAVYAIVWQQVLKRMDLTFAFSNKAVVIVWGILWGWLVFGEAVTPQKILGGCIIGVGIWLVVKDYD